MGLTETLKQVLLGHRAKNIEEQTEKDALISKVFLNVPQNMPQIIAKHVRRQRKYRTKCELCKDTTRYHGYPEAFRINMCETDIKAWLDREGYNGYGNRRLSQAFINYLMVKYGLDHGDVIHAGQRVRYRIHG